MYEKILEEILKVLYRQNELLGGVNMNLAGLRDDIQKAGKDAMENSMAKVMEQMKDMFKGTPLETMVPGFMARAKPGGNHGE